MPDCQLCLYFPDGGEIILSKCSRALEEGDGRSGWSFQGNSQLRIGKAGSWCLTQKNVNGSSAGFADIVASTGATAESSSNADEAHGPQKAIDRDTDTSWASELFEEPDEYPVTLDVNLGMSAYISGSFAVRMKLHACRVKLPLRACIF